MEEVSNIEDILNSPQISTYEYEGALSVSNDNNFQVNLKMPANSYYVNNYFLEVIVAWEANLDIHSVLNNYKVVGCMCLYLSKSEDELKQAMTEALKVAFGKNLYNYEQMKSVAYVYTSKREFSIQKCVYHNLSDH